MARGGRLDLGTYRTATGELVHAWYDGSGILMAERDGPAGRTPIDAASVLNAVKLSDDPYWPDEEPAVPALGEQA